MSSLLELGSRFQMISKRLILNVFFPRNYLILQYNILWKQCRIVQGFLVMFWHLRRFAQALKKMTEKSAEFYINMFICRKLTLKSFYNLNSRVFCVTTPPPPPHPPHTHLLLLFIKIALHSLNSNPIMCTEMCNGLNYPLGLHFLSDQQRL